MRATLELTGDIAIPGFVDCYIPNRKLDEMGATPGQAFSVKISENRYLAAVLGGRTSGPFGSSPLQCIGQVDPGVYPCAITMLDTQLGASDFAPHPLIGDDPLDIRPQVSVKGVDLEFALPPTLYEASATRQKWLWHGVGTVDGVQVVAEVETTLGARAPYFEFEGYVAVSDPSNPVPFLTVPGGAADVRVTFPENERFDHDIGFAWDGQDLDQMFSAARYSFRGRVLCAMKSQTNPDWDPNDGEPPGDVEAIDWPDSVGFISMRLDADEWDGYVGSHGGVFGSESWPLPSSYGFFDGPRMRDNPPGTGDAGAFSQIPMDPFFCRPSQIRRNIMTGVIGEARRQTAHFEAGGDPWVPDLHPDTVTYNSAPDPRFGGDLLSFTNPRVEGHIRLQDEGHMEHAYTFLAILLEGSFVARRTLEDQVKLQKAAFPNFIGQLRGWGRTQRTLSYGYMALGSHFAGMAYDRAAEKFEDLRQRFEWTRAEGYFGGEVEPGIVDRNPTSYPKLLSDYQAGWAPWQNAFIVGAVYDWTKIAPEIVPVDVVNDSLQIARTIVLEAFQVERDTAGNPIRLEVWYVLGWNDDGSPINPKVHRVSAYDSGSDYAFALQMTGAVVWAWAELTLDAKVRDKALEILRFLRPTSYDSARWTSNHRKVIEQATGVL